MPKVEVTTFLNYKSRKYNLNRQPSAWALFNKQEFCLEQYFVSIYSKRLKIILTKFH